MEVKILKIWRKAVLMYLGGMIYGALELLWRGRTHWSMILLGGVCFVLIGALGQVPKPLPRIPRALAAAGLVTALELGMGLLVNRHYQVWDYRTVPMNFRGQICLPFTLLWVPVCLAAIVLYDRLEQGIRANTDIDFLG